MDVLVTYDIDTTTSKGVRRLARVAKLCESYGTRVQFSVFECRISPVALVRFVAELDELIDARRDSINVYRFTGSLSDARKSLGRLPLHEPGQHWVV
jgi:CRISPR-associated protein Cas2